MLGRLGIIVSGMLNAVAFAQFPPIDTVEPHARATDAIFAAVDSRRSPGCAIAVMRDGRIIYSRGYGMADLATGIPNTPATVFHVGSVAKQFTASAVLLLAQDGLVGLDDDVRRYVPEVPDFGLAPITIRHLLHHTSGLRDQWELLVLAGWRYSRDLISDTDVLNVVSRQRRLNFAPGSAWAYSNTGYTLLARVVARASGKSFRQFTTERIFRPLGMQRSFFRDDHAEIVADIAHGYRPAGDGYRLAPTHLDTVGATSLLTTAEDLARWDGHFLTPRIGGAELIRQQLAPGALDNGQQLDYAAGLVIGSYRGLRTIEHGGGDAGYVADLLRFPDQRFGVAVLCNTATIDPSSAARRIADIHLAPLFNRAEPQTLELSTAVLASRVGTYLDSDARRMVALSLGPGGLRAAIAGSPVVGLRALGPDRLIGTYEDRAVAISFIDAAALRVSLPNEAERRYLRTPPYQPSTRHLADFVGAYASDEVDAVHRLVLDRDVLSLSSPKWTAPLRPVARDVFEFARGTYLVRFVRDTRERVVGYLINTARTMDVEFTKRS